MNYKCVFWDFDGVWSKDRFYKSFESEFPDIYNFIQTKIFGPNRDSKIDKWMRAELTHIDINRFISQETGIDFDILTKRFLEDVAKMEIETRHIPIVKRLKTKGIKVGMITNNMDVFDSITQHRLKFNQLFNENVFSSSAYKKLKTEGLFDIAMESSGHLDYKTTLLIDDSARARTAFEAKGGCTYPYTTFENFEVWANQNLL